MVLTEIVNVGLGIYETSLYNVEHMPPAIEYIQIGLMSGCSIWLSGLYKVKKEYNKNRSDRKLISKRVGKKHFMAEFDKLDHCITEFWKGSGWGATLYGSSMVTTEIFNHVATKYF